MSDIDRAYIENAIARINAWVARVERAAEKARQRGMDEEDIIRTVEEYEGKLSRLLFDLYALLDERASDE